MSVFLEFFVVIGFLAFFVASSVVGVRLLLLWRRTRELPELLIGLGVLGIGPVGFGFMVVGELCVAGAPGLAQILIGTGLAAMSVGSGAKYVFNWRVYHPRDRVLRDAGRDRLCCCWRSCLAWEYSTTGFRSLAHPGPSYFLRIGLQVGCLLWGSVEALRYWNRMRRRVRLLLADPVVSNRFLLWGLGAGAAGVGSAVGGLHAVVDAASPDRNARGDALLVAPRPRRGGRDVARLRSQRPLHALDPGPLDGLIRHSRAIRARHPRLTCWTRCGDRYGLCPRLRRRGRLRVRGNRRPRSRARVQAGDGPISEVTAWAFLPNLWISEPVLGDELTQRVTLTAGDRRDAR